METDWDAARVFDDDYLYFYASILSDARSDSETEVIASLASINPGSRILDLACGDGRISNRLATRGARVVGLDLTEPFLERARRDAEALGVDVEYVHGDMRDLPWVGEFDVVINWFTSFGYFDDNTDRTILRQIQHVLKQDGTLLLDLNHGPVLMRGFSPSSVVRFGDDLMTDERRLDPMSGRIRTTRTVIRGGMVRAFEFSTRVFAFPELRDWLTAAGFNSVEAFDATGQALTADSRRMVIRAAPRSR